LLFQQHDHLWFLKWSAAPPPPPIATPPLPDPFHSIWPKRRSGSCVCGCILLDAPTDVCTKVGIRNFTPHFHNIADNQIDCGITD
jgi:hypothetical protein